MGFKSIKKLVHRGSVTPPSESEIQKNEVRQQEKRQKEHHKAVAATKGKKVLPTNPEQEAEYRELNARMWQIEKKMQDDRAEVMKPRTCTSYAVCSEYSSNGRLLRHEGG